jgi:hypothetical protein
VKGTIGICTLADYFVAKKCQHQLNLGCVVKHHGDHKSFLDNLPDGTTMAQEIVEGSVYCYSADHLPIVDLDPKYY